MVNLIGMSEDILAGLNEQQAKAVIHESGPLLIVAGAGTGKTTVLARRYVWLLHNKQQTTNNPAPGGTPPSDNDQTVWRGKQSTTNERLTTENILALTFTEKAAQEMEDRVLQLLPNGTYDFWISTFHGFCQRILEEKGLDIGLPNRFRLLNETDGWLFMKRRLDDFALDHYRPLGNPVKFLSGLLKHISRVKDEGVTAEKYLEYAKDFALDGDAEFVTGERKRLLELADCYHTYGRLLREEGALDFGDLIMETLRLLCERPAALRDLRRRFRYIMVDEFQDTNWAQYELVKLLAGEEKNITVVGDDDQAIYKFRGASLANILQFRDDFPQASTVALTENYRSRQQVLDTAYNFIRRNDPHRLEVRLGLGKKLQAVRSEEGKVSAYWYGSLEEEAEAVAESIQRLKAEEPDCSWNDFAVLVRSNDGALPFVYALERHGIPFRFYALRGLYGKPLVIDIISLLSVAAGDHSSPSVWRALSMSCFGFRASDIAQFLKRCDNKGYALWETVKHAGMVPGLGQEAMKKAVSLVSFIEKLGEAARREPPLKVFQEALDKSGTLAKVLQMPEQEKTENISWLNGLADRIKRYEQSTPGPTLKNFLEELKMEIESGEEGALTGKPDDGPEQVKVMTVHASKGLEFRHVFVVSLVDQRFPTRERGDAIPVPEGLVNERLPEGDAHLEEERRLLYVALTRAKDTLTLTGASNYGGARQKKPSLFFAEAGLKPEDRSSPEKAARHLLLPDPRHDPASEERSLYPLKRRFSFTQLAAFRNCPLQYKLAHVYRVPVLGSYTKSFGQSIHLTFHDILKLHEDRGAAQQSSLFESSAAPPVPGFRVTLEEALAIYADRWIDEWYPNREFHDRYKQNGKDAVKAMWEKWLASPPKSKLLEHSFEWKIGEHSIKGTIDRMDELPDGGMAIYDYKTGNRTPGKELDASQKEQLRIYQLAMEERGYSVKKLAYLYVLTGEEIEVPLLQGQDGEEFKAKVLETMKGILASRFPPTPSAFTCPNCDFRNVCEFRKL